MNKIIVLLLFLLAGFLFLTSPFKNETAQQKKTSLYQKGVFIATVYNIDFPQKPGETADEQKAELLKIIETVKALGLDTIYFQAVPCCDALYNSKILPTSAFLSGEAGKKNDKNFDPLYFITTEADKQGISVYAWVNPYRIKSGTYEKPVNTLDFLPQSHPVKFNPSLALTHYNGSMYLDPGNPDTIKLITDVTAELCKNYNIAGIIFDDYFYPKKYPVAEGGKTVYKDFPDSITYSKYAKAGQSLDDWRRQNVTALIQAVSQTVHSANKSQKFGISPFGVWANKTDNPKGSDTAAQTSSYYDSYADTLLWVKNSYIDFIMPQIYWNIGFDKADFSKLLSWWEDAVKGTKTALYIAHAAYKVGDENQGAPWQDANEIRRQIEISHKNRIVSGNVLYGYSALCQNRLGMGDIIRDIFKTD